MTHDDQHMGRKPGPLRLLLIGTAAALLNQSAAAAPPQAWLTDADHRHILAPTPLTADAGGPAATIQIDPTHRFQRIDGFGFALTGGSAQLLQRMSPGARHALLVEMFGRGNGGMGVSWLRVSIGSSDMDGHVFTYDDQPNADPALAHFSLAPDEQALIPTLREILSIAPRLPILASPWSMPAWMKTNARMKGGMLRPDMSDAFARYLVAYVRGMAANGVPIWGITLQNEPENANNTPSMLMPAGQQAALIADHVGPAFRTAGLTTRIIDFDHNCDHPDYPLTVLGDAAAAPFVAGTGFHLYEGDPSAITRVHDAHPDKPVWLTEQMVIDDVATGKATPVAQPIARVLIGSLTNWAQSVLLWNLAADPNSGPHTNDGGCTVCEGAVTIDGNRVTRNVAYAAVAQFSHFVPKGSTRIGAISAAQGLPVVVFRTPDAATVVVVANTGSSPQPIRVTGAGTPVAAMVPSGAAITIQWPRGS